MRQTDDYEDHSGGLPIIYMALGVSVFILAVMGLVIATNKKPKRNLPLIPQETSTENNELSVDDYLSSKRTADDLDIWDMYPRETEIEPIEGHTETQEETTTEEASTEASLDDGNHIHIEYSDGSDEWVAINPYLPKNTYDYTNLISSDGRLKYYSNGRQISSLGVDISRYQKNVDFYLLKQDGIDFVMLRVGARGYKSGELQLDEYFIENIKKASEAGLQIGLYVYSQAITVDEALAEAQLILNNIGEYKITYPIAIDMEFVENDSARVETLTRDERTAIIGAFVNKIREAKYTPMIYGNTEWLVKRIDLSKFTDCCIWLSEETDMPKYPYQYELWQYSTKGQVNGIDGYVNLNLSFIDYSAR